MRLLEQARVTLEFLRGRKRNYQLAFGSPAGQVVLQDLVKFCRACETTYDADPRIHAALEGRREVFLRIQQHLNLSSEQLFSLYTGHQVQVFQGDKE
jgi:hypothetical protein